MHRAERGVGVCMFSPIAGVGWFRKRRSGGEGEAQERGEVGGRDWGDCEVRWVCCAGRAGVEGAGRRGREICTR
jgi:hypothetical protein